MKLNKLQFGRLVGFLVQNGFNYGAWEVEELDGLIDIEVPLPKEGVVPGVAVESLMKLMAAGTHKIEAIKQYRILTGEGLKESKEAVERHWSTKPRDVEPNATLGDILGKALSKKTAKQLMLEHLDNMPDGSTLRHFSEDTINHFEDFIKSFNDPV